MAEYDSTIGALILCSWFNCSLFTLEALGIYEYFSQFKNDSWLNKMFVSMALVSDIAGVLANTASVYLYAVTHFGDLVFVQSQPWTFPLYVTSSGVSGAITQVFLALRIWRLTGNWAYLVVFFSLSAASLGGALGTVIGVISATSFSDRIKLQTSVRIWVSCAAAVDILIALALVLILARTQTNFKDTGHILRKLMFTAVRTGSFTAGFAIIALVMYSLRPNDNISVFFSLSLGRLYTLSMLSNLNARYSNDDTSRGPSSGGAGDISSANRMDGGRSRGQSRTKGIKITSETVTRVDGEEMEREGTVGDRKQSFGMIPINESAMNQVGYDHGTQKDTWDDDHSLEHSQVDLVNKARR